MRTLLGLSLLANAILALVVLWLSRPARFNQTSPADISAQSTMPTGTAESQPAPVPAQPAAEDAPQAFRWSQLESPDYRTYVANLRSIGCPEQTIRDIVAADLDSAYYAPRRQELERQSAWTDPGSSTTAAVRLGQLQNEESAVIAGLLGCVVASGPGESTAKSDPNQWSITASYRAKWEFARLNADYSLRGAIGRGRFLDYLDQDYLNPATTAP